MMNKYESIESFKNLTKALVAKQAIPPKPIKFIGEVKLHGTNGGFFLENNRIISQSRNNILSQENTNSGFFNFVSEIEARLLSTKFFQTTPTLMVFGEFVGRGIQSGVAINNIPKSLFIFDFFDTETQSFINDFSTIDIQSLTSIDNVYFIRDFPLFEIEIDFKNPAEAVEKLDRLTQIVANECPVSKHFGYVGDGEGIVWKGYDDNGKRIVFKTKSEKFVVQKQKSPASLELENAKDIQEFVDSVLTENRLNQGVDVVFKEKGIEPDIKYIRDFLDWIRNDIKKEASDMILNFMNNNKDVTESNIMKAITNVSVTWFKKKVL